jgi:hypothetical protein
VRRRATLMTNTTVTEAEANAWLDREQDRIFALMETNK